MPAYNPNDYEDVDTRLHRFFQKHPNGRIVTDLIHHDDKRFIVKAFVYRDDDADVEPSATGLAEEIVGASPVNRTSALENCETSAIGRALANLGFSPKGQRPSREEMDKATRPQRGTVEITQSQVDGYAEQFAAASSLAVLDGLARQAAEYTMSDQQRAYLREVYSGRKAILAGEPATVTT